MADQVGEIEYEITGNTKGLIQSGKDVQKFNDQTQSGLEKTTKSVNKMDAGVARLAKTIGGLIAAQKLWNAAVEASNVGADFEESIADLAAITGAAGEDLRFLTDEAKRLGTTTRFSASQASAAFKLIASAKPDLLENAAALSQVTEQTLLLATAAGTDLTATAETVGTALNQFGAGAEEANRFVNVLAAGSKLGASEVNQTAEALKNAGVAAKNAGLSFEETNAAIQVLAANGIKAGEAGTALRSIFLSLETQAESRLKPSIVGLSEALANLNEDQLTAEEQAKLFGKEYSTLAGILIDSRGRVDELTEALTGTNIAQEQAAIKADTLRNSQLQLRSAIEGLQIAIAESSNPALRSLIDLLTEATQGATFFWQSLNEGSVQNLTSRMADANDEIKRLEKQLEETATVSGRAWLSITGQSTDPTFINKQLDEQREILANLRKEYIQISGLTPPDPNDIPPLELSITPTVTPETSAKTKEFSKEEGIKASKAFIEGFGAALEEGDGFATGISASIALENETIFEELQRQRELIQEFQELEIGDAQAHADALIAIDKKEKEERMKLQSQLLSATSDFFDGSAELIGAFAGESSSAYKALFAVSKGFAIANAALQLQTAIANASALPFPANVPAIAQAVSLGGQIASNIAGLTYGGGRENGGPVTAGKYYEVGEGNKPELFQMDGRQYMIPGNNGQVLNQSQMGGGSTTYAPQTNITVQGDADIGKLKRMLDKRDAENERKFADSMRNKNGVYYNSITNNTTATARVR